MFYIVSHREGLNTKIKFIFLNDVSYYSKSSFNGPTLENHSLSFYISNTKFDADFLKSETTILLLFKKMNPGRILSKVRILIFSKPLDFLKKLLKKDAELSQFVL